MVGIHCYTGFALDCMGQAIVKKLTFCHFARSDTGKVSNPVDAYEQVLPLPSKVVTLSTREETGRPVIRCNQPLASAFRHISHFQVV